MQNVQHMYNGIIMDSRASYTFKVMDNFTIQAYKVWIMDTLKLFY